jgi:proteasome accessory factor C
MSADSNHASAQLRRLLLALPALADGEAHVLDDVAARVGTDVPTLERDLRTLVTRGAEEPGGFTEGVQLLLGADSVRLQTRAGHFRRPMALSLEELHALELGIAMLQQEAPPDEALAMRRARERLQKAMVVVEDDAPDAHPDRFLSLGAESLAARTQRRALQDCIRERCVATITYRSASRDVDDERRVRPLGFVWARGTWYLVAYCERNSAMRVFRLDRIRGVSVTTEHFEPAEGFALESVLREGRVLTGESDAVMRVRFTPHVARWIAERERRPLEADGSVVVEYPLMEFEWGVRKVLGYGPDAEVEAPEELRVMLVERLRALAQSDESS